jgi:hypothetical protein
MKHFIAGKTNQTVKTVERGLLLACLLVAAGGATRAGLLTPFRTWNECKHDACQEAGVRTPLREPVSPPTSSPAIAGDEPSSPRRVIHRSTSRSRLLDFNAGMQDNNVVYKAVVQQGSSWRGSPEPVTSSPLIPDRSNGVYTFIKTKLYPHLSFWEVAAGWHLCMQD